MIKNEKELVQKLTCDELCAITKKKERNLKLRNQKLVKLAKTKMQNNSCPIC
ncbi:MAG: hypothetical protein PHX27_00695 [Candidatus ainarchaeum sp.]|nr:hypothetical protein [Candidatus ainarchaeum sp.]